VSALEPRASLAKEASHNQHHDAKENERRSYDPCKNPWLKNDQNAQNYEDKSRNNQGYTRERFLHHALASFCHRTSG